MALSFPLGFLWEEALVSFELILLCLCHKHHLQKPPRVLSLNVKAKNLYCKLESPCIPTQQLDQGTLNLVEVEFLRKKEWGKGLGEFQIQIGVELLIGQE